jgi:hypothetical protein
MLCSTRHCSALIMMIIAGFVCRREPEHAGVWLPGVGDHTWAPKSQQRVVRDV